MNKINVICMLSILSISCASRITYLIQSPYDKIHCLYNLDKISHVIERIDTTQHKISDIYNCQSMAAFPLIDESGNIIDIKLNEHLSPSIDSLIINIINRMEFNPLMIDTLKVKYTLLLMFHFKEGKINILTGKGNTEKLHKKAKDDQIFSPDKIFIQDYKPPTPIGGLNTIQKSLVYPESAIEKKIEGRVILYIFISEDGFIGPYKVIESPSNDLSIASYDAITKVKWIPAKLIKNGNPCFVWNAIPIGFKL